MTNSQTISMVFAIILFLIAIVSLAFSIYKSISLAKDKRVGFPMKPYLIAIAIGCGIFSLAFPSALSCIYSWNGYNANPGEVLSTVIGGLVFGCAFSLLINTFIVHYYTKNLCPKLDKALFAILITSIPVSLISFFVTTNGFADMGGLHFLLPSGINFTKGFAYPNEIEKPHIAFYAVCILSGALFVYFLSDHISYKEYGKHGTLDATFFSAFPAGILGARIAYVIGNWTRDGFDYRVMHGEWWSIFAIWEGGLTILGGAIAGIIVGILVYMKTNKGRSIFRAIDICVPTILIAQAVGRWGNFFNCEVHGGLVPEEYWTWLPRIIFNNAHYSSAGGLDWAESGYIYAPLFFIECLTNLLGYFVIAHLFGIKFKDILRPGDQGAAYLIWYGFTRIFMEPLRHPSFKMGEKDFWSWTWAIVFVIVGTLLIALNHFIRYRIDKKNNKDSKFSKNTYLITASIFGSLMVASLIGAIILLTQNTFVVSLELNPFNIGIILLAIAVALLILMVPIIYQLFDKLKMKEAQNG